MKIDPTKRPKTTGEELLDADVPEAIAQPQGAEPDFIQRGRASFRQMLSEAANYRELRKTPYGLRPVFIFTVVGIFSTLSLATLSSAIPEISLDLNIRVLSIIEVLSIVAFVLIFVGIVVAYLGDRVRRVPIYAIGRIIQGIFSFTTSRVTSHSTSAAGQMGAAQGAERAGFVAVDVVDGSLLADYYPPESRGKAYALRGVMANLVRVTAPLTIAYLVTATALEWRLPYLIAAPLLIIGGVAALFLLKEPVRGYMERRAMGASEEVARIPEEPPSMGEAWRTIWSIRTLRRLFISDIPFHVGDFIFGVFIAPFLFQEYGMSITERAVLVTVVGLVALPFGFLSGGMVDVLIRRRPQRVLIFTGTLSLFASFFVYLISTKPPVWMVYVFFSLFGAAAALVGPARSVLYAQVFPAHVRTLGFSVRGLAEVPGFFIRGAILSFVLERYGFRGEIAVAAPFLLLSALIEISAAGFYERDMRAAMASQIASDEWRQAKAAGKGKLLVCRDLDVDYDGVQVLFGVDFDVEQGDIIALLGTNGAGKSTLLRAISGTQEASAGAIVYDGRDITHMPSHEIAQRGVIHMPGGRGVFPGLTVRENILLGTWVTDQDEIKGRLDEVYRIFPMLKERAGTQAGQLSGGEQQMVSLAQALLAKPRLLMIDELSLGLSPAVIQELIEIVKKIHESGVTIIVVEQSVNIALTIARRAIFMEKGEVKFFGNTADLLRRPDILRAVYVKGTGALTEGAPGSALKTARELREYELEQARPILEVRNLTKSYGGINAVDDVSFDLKEGETLGLIGPNGAGKTTVFDIISGYQVPDKGRVIFDGVDVTGLRADERANRRLVRRFQDARLFPSLTVFENLLVALDRKLEVRGMVFTALQVPQVRKAERRLRLRAERLIELLELGAYRDKFVRELSTGLRRITDLACVLATEPKVLLLDEPSSGIAQAEAEGLAPLLRRVRFETGCSMLVIEHDMPLISAIVDEMIAMDQGKIVMRAEPEVVLNDERVIESYLGTSEDAVRRSGVIE